MGKQTAIGSWLRPQSLFRVEQRSLWRFAGRAFPGFVVMADQTLVLYSFQHCGTITQRRYDALNQGIAIKTLRPLHEPRVRCLRQT